MKSLHPTFGFSSFSTRPSSKSILLLPLFSSHRISCFTKPNNNNNIISGMLSSLGIHLLGLSVQRNTKILELEMMETWKESEYLSMLNHRLVIWERLDGVDSEAAARKFRGRAGTSVTVKVHSATESTSNSSIREVNLPREYIKPSPISSTIIPHQTPDGRQTKTGCVKLSTFSQSAAADMANAINELETQGMHSYILDLRNNPGGSSKSRT